MATRAEIENRLKTLNEKLADYIPPRETWTPADEALFKPPDLLRVPTDEAQQMQFKGIKYAFTHHHTHNRFYREYCKGKGVTPDDLKTTDDFDKIPLLPDVTFKTHPSGKDFAYWITSIFTGDLPRVVIKGANPSFDDIINAFNEQAGLKIAYSTGTTGRHSVIPRDKRTFYTFQYAMTKMRLDLVDELGVDHSLSLFPRPTQTNLYAGQVMEFQYQSYKDHHCALDAEISADQALRAMTGQDKNGGVSLSAMEQMRKVFENGTAWLERYEHTPDTVMLVAPPAVFSSFMDSLERMGKRFAYGERGTVLTGGGWKTRENERIAADGFRKRIEEVLGIPETHCIDGYGMVEMNAGFVQCPEGHYYHLPYTSLRPLILDELLTPIGYGEWGRLAFLDPIAYSYPGFIITGDRVRMLEHCPVCDREGPVLDTVIERAASEEVRGCAEEVRRTLEQGLEAR